MASASKPQVINPAQILAQSAGTPAPVTVTPPENLNAPTGKPRVTLAMIVKNEAHVIERCLTSVLPVIDHWVIVDTGSTDGTQEIIKNFFKNVGKEGKLYERPWVNFAHNRSELLALARPEADYSLMIDADEILVYDSEFDPEQWKKSLIADLYSIFAKFGATEYHRPQLTSNRIEFYYRCALHEYVAGKDEVKTKGFVQGFINQPIQDGARSKNPKKYQDDAETLLKEVQKMDPKAEDYNRCVFYLAQCYRDAGMWNEALEWYTKRAQLQGWDEEVYYSVYQTAIMKLNLGRPLDDVIRAAVDAYSIAPYRAEPLWFAANLCRLHGRYQQGYYFAKAGLRVPLPKGRLFVTLPIYEFELAFEACIMSYWCEDFKFCRDMCFKLLQVPNLPPQHRNQIENNLKHVQQLLATIV